MSPTPAPQGPPDDPASARQTGGSRAAASEPSPSPWERLQQWLDRLLVLDVFLVIGAALWFGAAVLLHARGVEAPLQLFQKLWEPLFTPAIGLLMAAALLSGALGWWRRRGRT
jgi:hypothetical protein